MRQNRLNKAKWFDEGKYFTVSNNSVSFLRSSRTPTNTYITANTLEKINALGENRQQRYHSRKNTPSKSTTPLRRSKLKSIGEEVGHISGDELEDMNFLQHLQNSFVSSKDSFVHAIQNPKFRKYRETSSIPKEYHVFSASPFSTKKVKSTQITPLLKSIMKKGGKKGKLIFPSHKPDKRVEIFLLANTIDTMLARFERDFRYQMSNKLSSRLMENQTKNRRDRQENEDEYSEEDDEDTGEEDDEEDDEDDEEKEEERERERILERMKGTFKIHCMGLKELARQVSVSCVEQSVIMGKLHRFFESQFDQSIDFIRREKQKSDHLKHLLRDYEKLISDIEVEKEKAKKEMEMLLQEKTKLFLEREELKRKAKNVSKYEYLIKLLDNEHMKSKIRQLLEEQTKGYIEEKKREAREEEERKKQRMLKKKKMMMKEKKKKKEGQRKEDEEEGEEEEEVEGSESSRVNDNGITIEIPSPQANQFDLSRSTPVIGSSSSTTSRGDGGDRRKTATDHTEGGEKLDAGGGLERVDDSMYNLFEKQRLKAEMGVVIGACQQIQGLVNNVSSMLDISFPHRESIKTNSITYLNEIRAKLANLRDKLKYEKEHIYCKLDHQEYSESGTLVKEEDEGDNPNLMITESTDRRIKVQLFTRDMKKNRVLRLQRQVRGLQTILGRKNKEYVHLKERNGRMEERLRNTLHIHDKMETRVQKMEVEKNSDIRKMRNKLKKRYEREARVLREGFEEDKSELLLEIEAENERILSEKRETEVFLFKLQKTVKKIHERRRKEKKMLIDEICDLEITLKQIKGQANDVEYSEEEIENMKKLIRASKIRDLSSLPSNDQISGKNKDDNKEDDRKKKDEFSITVTKKGQEEEEEEEVDVEAIEEMNDVMEIEMMRKKLFRGAESSPKPKSFDLLDQEKEKIRSSFDEKTGTGENGDGGDDPMISISKTAYEDNRISQRINRMRRKRKEEQERKKEKKNKERVRQKKIIIRRSLEDKNLVIRQEIKVIEKRIKIIRNQEFPKIDDDDDYDDHSELLNIKDYDPDFEDEKKWEIIDEDDNTSTTNNTSKSDLSSSIYSTISTASSLLDDDNDEEEDDDLHRTPRRRRNKEKKFEVIVSPTTTTTKKKKKKGGSTSPKRRFSDKPRKDSSLSSLSTSPKRRRRSVDRIKARKSGKKSRKKINLKRNSQKFKRSKTLGDLIFNDDDDDDEEEVEDEKKDRKKGGGLFKSTSSYELHHEERRTSPSRTLLVKNDGGIEEYDEDHHIINNKDKKRGKSGSRKRKSLKERNDIFQLDLQHHQHQHQEEEEEEEEEKKNILSFLKHHHHNEIPKEKSLEWTLKLIHSVYSSKLVEDRHQQQKQGFERFLQSMKEDVLTLPQFFYGYVKYLYGVQGIIEQIIHGVVSTLDEYKLTDSRVRIFHHFLMNVYSSEVCQLFLMVWKVFHEIHPMGPQYSCVDDDSSSFDDNINESRNNKIIMNLNKSIKDIKRRPRKTSKVKILYVLSILKERIPPSILEEIIKLVNLKSWVEEEESFILAMEAGGYLMRRRKDDDDDNNNNDDDDGRYFNCIKYWGISETDARESIFQSDFFEILCNVSEKYYSEIQMISTAPSTSSRYDDNNNNDYSNINVDEEIRRNEKTSRVENSKNMMRNSQKITSFERTRKKDAVLWNENNERLLFNQQQQSHQHHHHQQFDYSSARKKEGDENVVLKMDYSSEMWGNFSQKAKDVFSHKKEEF